MATKQEYGNSHESNESYWPSADQTSEPRYQAPNGYTAAASADWTAEATASYIPLPILKQAEKRVACQKGFFIQLFIYLAAVVALWIMALLGFYEGREWAVPLLITAVGALWIAWSFFNAFIWGQKSQQERVMSEARKLMS